MVLGFISFWGLVRECQAFHEEGEWEDGVVCIAGAISTGISAITHMKEIQDWFIEISKEVKVQYIGDFTRAAINHLNGIGPWLNGVGVGAMGNAKRDSLLKRAEMATSARLGVEVRHIGYWDGSMPGQPRKRDEKSWGRPIFGLQIKGRDYHFTLMDGDIGINNTWIKLGSGPGVDTEHNRRRLQARKPKYNGQWFDHGGLDIIGRSDIMANGNNPDIQPDPNNQEDFDWILKHVTCSLGVGHEGHPSSLDEPGLYFQIYDNNSKGTLSAGAIAPFTPEKESIITWMEPESALLVNDQCTRL